VSLSKSEEDPLVMIREKVLCSGERCLCEVKGEIGTAEAAGRRGPGRMEAVGNSPCPGGLARKSRLGDQDC